MHNNTNEMNEFFRRYLREKEIGCNCGGPQYGTDHAPDCAIELAWDEACAVFQDENEAMTVGTEGTQGT